MTPQIATNDQDTRADTSLENLLSAQADSEMIDASEDSSDAEGVDHTGPTRHAELVAEMNDEPLPQDTNISPEDDEAAAFEGTSFQELNVQSLLRDFLHALYAMEGLGQHQGTGVMCQNQSSGLVRILDANGIFTYRVFQCLCPDGLSVPLQFMQMTLFPATYEKVKTAVTFKALKLSQLHNFGGKESVWDFYEVIRRWTNNVNPLAVPLCNAIGVKVIYPQFRRTKLLWGALRMVMRSGHLELAIPRGGLVVGCPTCPAPGVNLPENWMDEPLARLKYSSMLAIDGNFHLQRNNKGIGKDAPLTGNSGFWVDDGELEDYIVGKGAKVEDHERSLKASCSSFKAGDPSRWAQKSGKSVSGVAMVSCGRHSFIQPNGTVDLDKGERFAYVDVAFASVLRQQHPQQRHIHTYDIGCKYGIKFQERVTRSLLGPEVETDAIARGSLPSDVLIAPSDFPPDFCIKVPSWHVLGHTLPCVLANNLRYTPLVGRTAGEGVETIWAVMNAHQYATREMTHGHRRDALTDVFNDYNWKKLCGEGTSNWETYYLSLGLINLLLDKARRVTAAYFVALQMLESKRAELRSIEESIGEERVKMLTGEAAKRSNEQYAAQVAKGPSRANVLLALKKAEDEETLSRMEDHSSVGWPENQRSGALFLSNAMELEDLQYQLRNRNLDEFIAEGTGGADKRRTQHLRSLDALRRRCEEHLSALAIVCPSLPAALITRSQDPTSQDLYLPSQFARSERHAYGLDELATKEGELRVGNAHDHISALKDALGLRSLLVQVKKTHSRGHTQNTRSEASIKRAAQVVKRHKHGYQRNWRAMAKLGVTADDGSPAAGLQELRDSDVRNLKDFLENREYGNQSEELPWIWRSVGKVVSPGASVAEVQEAIENWEHEVLRLSWVHARAARDRWWEERVLLYEELRRIGATFGYHAVSWGGKRPPSHLPLQVRNGFRAYVLKKAAVFQTLGKEARTKFEELEPDDGGSESNMAPVGAQLEPRLETIGEEAVSGSIGMEVDDAY
ncbi:hypothetical protein FRC05_009837 [Tulasnella sp. 425]|nr:hypothetical protein FRC05_009837 [Tulasnella sp. 425]